MNDLTSAYMLIRDVIGITLVSLATVLVALGFDLGYMLQAPLAMANHPDTLAVRGTLIGLGLLLYGLVILGGKYTPSYGRPDVESQSADDAADDE